MRKPPIFWQPLTGNKAQDYLHRARMFKDAATQLPDYSNAQQNWPKYALLTHAIELSLKAFAERAVWWPLSAVEKEAAARHFNGAPHISCVSRASGENCRALCRRF